MISEEMPQSHDERLNLLNSIRQEGIEKLLVVAKNKKVLETSFACSRGPHQVEFFKQQQKWSKIS